MTQGSAYAVRNLIIDRMMDGHYPIGTQLPTSRDFAAEVGAHRNTVVKAYQQLAELGLVTVRQGRGTFVVSLPDEPDPVSQDGAASAVLWRQLATALAHGRRQGLSEAELRGIIDRQLERLYSAERRALFVECNSGDAEMAVRDIETLTGLRLTPMLLDQFIADPGTASRDYDVVVTILAHVKEVTDAVVAAVLSTPVIGIYTVPDEDALSQLARIQPGSRVGIIVDYPDGVSRFTNQINSVTTVDTVGLVSPTDDAIRALSHDVDMFVCNHSRSAHVRGLNLSVPVIELRFHVSRQSTARVAEALLSPLEALGPAGLMAPSLGEVISSRPDHRRSALTLASNGVHPERTSAP